jgi:hypothetical protein
VSARKLLEETVATFAALAAWLDALTAERSRPWWRRFVG